MSAQKIFDILLLIISGFGLYDFVQTQGILMAYWSLMAIPLFLSVFFGKKLSPVFWQGLFVIGIVVLLIKDFTILGSENITTEFFATQTILIFLTFNLATILFIYRSWLGGKKEN